MTQNWPPKPRILYAFQGTGNGHASRATELIPILKKHADIDVLCSGANRQLDLNFTIDFQYEGLSFYYNSSGGLDYLKSMRKAKFANFYREVKSLDLKAYDLVLNDFEPVSAYAAKRQDVPCLGLSHQASFLSAKSPRPSKRQTFPEWVFRHYAPVKKAIGFHFKSYDDFIEPPVIREEIKMLERSKNGKYVVYLPAYSEAYLKQSLARISNKNWLVFSKECEKPYQFRNVSFRPISSKSFLEQLAACEGLLCSAGFEAPAEALYLKKKLFVIPIKGQYEQECNAAALREMGVGSCTELNQKGLKLLEDWAYNEKEEIEALKVADPQGLIPAILGEYLSVKS